MDDCVRTGLRFGFRAGGFAAIDPAGDAARGNHPVRWRVYEHRARQWNDHAGECAWLARNSDRCQLRGRDSGQFSGQFYGCDTPTCLQRGIFGSADFDSTSVSLTGTALPAGPVLGSCQGGGIDIFTYGEVFFTTCSATISGKPTGPFQLLIDAPVEVPKAEGNFCISQNPLVALVEAPVCASAYTVGSFIPF